MSEDNSAAFRILGITLCLIGLVSVMFCGCLPPRHRVVLCRDHDILGYGHIDICLVAVCEDYHTRRQVPCPRILPDPIKAEAK